MLKKFIILASALAVSTGAFAQEASKPQLKWYGFIRNYFAYDSRVSSAGTEDLYYYMPKDEELNVDGKDVNAISSFRFASITSRLGLDVNGYEAGGYKIGAKIETDFYSGITGVTGTAQLRLRQAYLTVANSQRNWKVGQAWHPMAADLPDIFSLESGVPFGAFSRTPQVAVEQKVAESLSLTAAAIWQMQYTSTGPNGNVADYIKYSCVPEIYVGMNFKGEKGIARVGVDMLSIKPRNVNALGQLVNDRLTTLNYFVYANAKLGDFDFKAKAIYANDGSHMNLVGGYGVSKINADGSWEYSSSRSASAWITAKYTRSKTWVPSILLGYSEQFGTKDEIVGAFWKKNSADTVNNMWRIQPEVIYNLGKLSFGLELMVTGVEYGTPDAYRHAVTDLHTVVNYRVQSLVRYTF